MLNVVWVFLILVAILCGALTGRMDEVTRQSLVSAKGAVTLAIGLIGVMAFWLGMMRIARDAGLLRVVARKIEPLMRRLFPDVPADHPAMSAMIMNMASNMLGLANAATPFGIKAMMELDKLNKQKGTATNAMALFLAINTSNVALFPTGVIGVRAALGSNNASAILFTTFFATLCSTIVAVFVAKGLSRLPRYQIQMPEGYTNKADDEKQGKANTTDDTSHDAKEDAEEDEAPIIDDEELGPTEFPPTPVWARLVQWGFWLTLLFAATVHVGYAYFGQLGAEVIDVTAGSMGWVGTHFTPSSTFALVKDLLSFWLLPVLMAALILYGVSKGVRVYESIVVGAKEGFDVAIRIIPFLVALLVAISMFRASGAMDYLVWGISPLTNLLGLPAEALPMAIMRPLSGSGAFGVMAEIMQTHGPDSLIGIMVSTFQGSTETTFYVMAVYFGAVQVKKTRHTLWACLCADAVGIIAAVWICRMLFLP